MGGEGVVITNNTLQKITSNVVILKKCQKLRFLRYLKVVISKFCPVGHLILNFYKKNITTPRTIWAL